MSIEAKRKNRVAIILLISNLLTMGASIFFFVIFQKIIPNFTSLSNLPLLNGFFCGLAFVSATFSTVFNFYSLKKDQVDKIGAGYTVFSWGALIIEGITFFLGKQIGG